jgi:hypothetical protein
MKFAQRCERDLTVRRVMATESSDCTHNLGASRELWQPSVRNAES